MLSRCRTARQRILITGASSGLGEGMARRFAAMGRDLALAARRIDRLASLQEELLAAHPGPGRGGRDGRRRPRVGRDRRPRPRRATGRAGPVRRQRRRRQGRVDRHRRGGGQPRRPAHNVLGAHAQCEAAMEIFARRAPGTSC